jgi:hypothetical protein
MTYNEADSPNLGEKYSIHSIQNIKDVMDNNVVIFQNIPAPFWESIELPDIPFFGNPVKSDSKILFLSGPSRNGNHLLHSLLDSHPALPRLPGEDSVINFIFAKLMEDVEAGVEMLLSDRCAEFLVDLSMKGQGNKWLSLDKHVVAGSGDKESSAVWSGMYRGQSRDNFTFDYQDTVVNVSYSSFWSELKGSLCGLDRPDRLIDQLDLYARALGHLDPDFKDRREGLQYKSLLFGSGTRGQLDWMMKRSKEAKAIVPLRPFETYYFSFAKGFFNTTDVRGDLLKEAWEHWWHKAVDYLHLKLMYPEQVCLVRFDSLVQAPREAVTEICKFLEIPFHDFCLTPTVLGHPTKGNSSVRQDEKVRGSIYKTSSSKKLDTVNIPEVYPDFWMALQQLAI